jgi:hypothetical protein
VATILGRRLGWDERRLASEIEHYRARVAEDVAWRDQGRAGQRA